MPAHDSKFVMAPGRHYGSNTNGIRYRIPGKICNPIKGIREPHSRVVSVPGYGPKDYSGNLVIYLSWYVELSY